LFELELAKFAGVLLGVFLRTWLPARRKAKAAEVLGKVFVWRKVFLKTALVSFCVAFFSALLLIPSVAPGEPVSLFVGFGLAFGVGFGANGASNEVYSLFFDVNGGEQLGPA